jgi:hypothetical protein
MWIQEMGIAQTYQNGGYCNRKDITNNYFNFGGVCDSGTATLEQQLQLER